MDEHELIKAIRSQVAGDPAGTVGIGDDCCVWTPGGPTCLSVDSIVEGHHFTADTPAPAVGRKAAAAALSDIAAMGGRPLGAAVALHCPSHWDGLAVMEGLLEELQRHGCHCYGGDTTGAEQLVVSVTVWGEAVEGSRLVQRSGAQAGDLLVVTGYLGGSLRHGRHLCPEPRFPEGQWFARQQSVTAMMDLSDGLAGDAASLAQASHCGCLLLPSEVPRHRDVDQNRDITRQLLCGGEDFELLVAIDPAAWPTIQVEWPFSTPISSVGWLIEQPGSYIEDPNGRMVPSPYTGFVHNQQ